MSTMDPKLRRGPRHRTGQYLPSPSYREALNHVLATRLGISVHQVEHLRHEWPALIGAAIRIMRERGEHDAVAAIIAPIDAAVAGAAFADETAATLAEEAAENQLNLVEKRYALTQCPTDRRELLRLSAREMNLQAERDNLLRQAGTA